MDYTYPKKETKSAYQLRSPKPPYRINSHADLEIALQIKAAEIDSLINEITDLESEAAAIKTKLLKAMKDEKWMIDSHYRQFTNTGLE